MNRFVVISGCSGGGKSTLLAELGRRGYAVVEEPGRRIVQTETRTNGTALPRTIDEYVRLLDAYPSQGYSVSIVPKVSVMERADFVLNTLDKC